jgi:ribose 1,5-bisphosphokinase PhnN
MTPEFKRRFEQRLAESAASVAVAKEIFARREQRLREWEEDVARRRARLRRLTFGLLGREPSTP